MEFEKKLQEFEIKLKRAEKLLFLSKFFKSKKIILSSLEELSDANKIISLLILQFNYTKKLVNVSRDPKINKKILNEKIGKAWGLEKEFILVSELMRLNEKHKKSSTEFLRKNRIVILDENQQISFVDTQLLKQYLHSIKKIKEVLKQKIRE